MTEGLSKKKKIEYFWNYYKVPFLVVLAVLAVGIYFLHAALTQKETALNVILMDSHAVAEGSQMADDFEDYVGLDAGKEALIQDSYMLADSTTTYAMTSVSKFYSEIGTKSLDVCGMTEKDFTTYTQTDAFLDLGEYLTKEQLEKLDGQLYMDGDKVLGIYAKELPVMQADGCYQDEAAKAVIGIVYNTEHLETALTYLGYIAGI